jgi:aminoglycoside phosphotransferase family enzyme
MDKKQVEKIIENGSFPGSSKKTEMVETHISWIILTEDFAYKIKRPVKLSFLDFSTLDNRKHFCEEELRLNSRIEPEMYLDVLPVTKKLEITENAQDEEVVDYALRMKRMDNAKEMDRLLADDKVTTDDIEKLARKIAHFHKNTRVIKNAFRTLKFHEEFADIANQIDFISEKLGDEAKQKVSMCIEYSRNYLNKIRSFSNERVISGFQRDCHGDLNASNIFLYSEPVIFDCIEFSSELRQIDVLNDIAFLCVDLDFYGREDLSRLFYQKYRKYFGLRNSEEEIQLFQYYKSYRANVRAKVTLINIQKQNDTDNTGKLDDAKKYIDLMTGYMDLENLKL